MSHWSKIKCIDIGRYTFGIGNVEFVHSKLVKMWQNVKNAPSQYDALQDAMQFHTQWGMSGTVDEVAMGYGAHTSLRCWVGLYEQLFENDRFEAIMLNTNRSDEDRRLLGFYNCMLEGVPHQWEWPEVWTPKWKNHPLTGKKVTALHELGPHSHPEVLAWATELLSVNMEWFHKMDFGIPPDRELSPARWVEYDGVEHAGKLYAARTEEVWENGVQSVPLRLRKEFLPWDHEM